MIDCKFFEYSDQLDKSQPNCIVLQKKGSDFQQLIVMNSKECQLFMDKSNPEASWSLMCDSIAHRSGIEIMDGNWDLVASCIDGNKRPLH